MRTLASWLCFLSCAMPPASANGDETGVVSRPVPTLFEEQFLEMAYPLTRELWPQMKPLPWDFAFPLPAELEPSVVPETPAIPEGFVIAWNFPLTAEALRNSRAASTDIVYFGGLAFMR